MSRILLGLALLVAGCGVTAGNPGDTGRKATFTLHGLVQTLEPDALRAERVTVFDAHQDAVTSTTWGADGSYRIDALAPGDYSVQFGRNWRQPVSVRTDTLLNVILPLPTGPVDFRHIQIGPREFCLLWDDRSGLEAGFRLAGPRELEIPGNRIGLRIYFPNPYVGENGQLDFISAIERWNEAFAGVWHLWTWNEYGDSASVSTRVEAFDVAIWDLPEPAYREGDPDWNRCMSVPSDVDDPRFIEP